MITKTSAVKPIIGISASVLTIESGYSRGRKRLFVGEDYINSILLAGGTPIVLPILADPFQVEQQMQLIDGVLLSGGCDVHPHLYGEEPHPLLQDLYPERDEYEMQLIKMAYHNHKPLLGICRGAQLLNVTFGGTLYQDVSLYSKDIIQHLQKAEVHVGTHKVKITDHSILKQTLEVSQVNTNSFHHQSVKKLAESFRVNAITEDGIIEGIEKEDRSFMMGVQWHPELMTEKQTENRKLFEGLVKASQKRKNYVDK